MKYLIAVTLISASLLNMPVSQAQNDDNNQAKLIEQLAARVQYLEDMAAIQQLQSKYLQLLFTQDYDKIVDQCFARKAEDVSVEFSDSGVYKGSDSVRRLYADFERTKRIPGFFTMHLMVDPYIVIARDGRTARSSWMSPGASRTDIRLPQSERKKISGSISLCNDEKLKSSVTPITS